MADFIPASPFQITQFKQPAVFFIRQAGNGQDNIGHHAGAPFPQGEDRLLLVRDFIHEALHPSRIRRGLYPVADETLRAEGGCHAPQGGNPPFPKLDITLQLFREHHVFTRCHACFTAFRMRRMTHSPSSLLSRRK